MTRGVHKHFFRFAYRSIGNLLVFFCDCEGKGSCAFVNADFFTTGRGGAS